LILFFFSSRRRHTRFSRDWSSDVCSSDLLTGRTYGAEDGQALGLSHHLVEPGEGLKKGLELAAKIASNTSLTNFAIIHALPRIAESDRTSGYLTESLVASLTQSGSEAKARLRAFLEKRAPKVVRD